MLYPRYVFMTYGSYETHWWIPPDDEDVFHQCSPANRTRVLHRSLAATHIQFINGSDDQDLGMPTETRLVDVYVVVALMYNVCIECIAKNPKF